MDSPVSKFTATSTENSWAQSYSAGKLNIVLSLEGELEGIEIASLGKDTLEKFQREFFAIDQKSLENLKKVTREVAKTVPSEITLSLVLSTIVDNVLYIVTADSGCAILKRGKNISVIAEGNQGEILGFSGKIHPQDTILLGTADLYKTISLSDIGNALHLKTQNEIGESLAPFLHEKAKGTEAGITWIVPGVLTNAIPPNIQEDNQLEQEQRMPGTSLLTQAKSQIIDFIKYIPIPRRINKKYAIIIAAAVLVLFLVGSIFIEKNNRKQNKELKAADSLIFENRQEYEDAIALMSINKSLAVNDLVDIKNNIEEGAKSFTPNSAAGKKLQEFLNEVNSALGGEGGTSKISLFLNAKNKEISNFASITTKGETISAVGDGKGEIITSSGEVEKTYSIKGNSNGITADEDNIFVLSGSEVFQIPRNTLKPKSIIDSDKDPISIDTFGGNVYLLSKKGKTIYRYKPNNFSQESYLSGVDLENPVSMAIDSSIYVIDNGKIRKFTRGREDGFPAKNETSFSNSSKIFTDIDYVNLYVLDPEEKKAYVVDKSGNQVNEFSLKGLKNITSIAASEKDKKIYVTTAGNIYSISF